MNAPLPTPLKFDSPATYQIVVHGYIAARSTEYLEGMSHPTDTRCGASHLSPRWRVSCSTAQAASARVLNTLYDMHLPVLSVQCLHAASRTTNSLRPKQLPERSTTHG